MPVFKHPCTGTRATARKARVAGFTLIEVMIAVVIVGILAAVAAPSYQSSVRRGNRSDAMSLLQSANLAQERHRLGNTTYSSVATSLTPPCPNSGSCQSERQHYTLAVSNATATSYTLTANAASTLQQADTGCTAIVLRVSGGSTSYTPAGCWAR